MTMYAVFKCCPAPPPYSIHSAFPDTPLPPLSTKFIMHGFADFARAVKVHVAQPHDHAVPAPCPHFGACGGCALQSLSYDAQLQHKQGLVVEALARVGKVGGAAGQAASRFSHAHLQCTALHSPPRPTFPISWHTGSTAGVPPQASSAARPSF